MDADYVVVRHGDVASNVLTESKARALALKLNEQYQTDEYRVEAWR